MMKAFKKVVRLGTVGVPGRGGERGPRWGVGRLRPADVFAKIDWDGKRLSISGVEGPLPGGDCQGSCGQIVMHLNALEFLSCAPGWDTNRIAIFLTLWDRWHLNDMTAGSPAQEALLRQVKGANPGWIYSYEAVSKLLEEAGLNPDPGYLHKGKPYRYGTAWLTEEVPEGALKFLAGLPGSDKTPAWV